MREGYKIDWVFQQHKQRENRIELQESYCFYEINILLNRRRKAFPETEALWELYNDLQVFIEEMI